MCTRVRPPAPFNSALTDRTGVAGVEVILRTDGAGLRQSWNALGHGVAVTNRTQVLLFLLIRLAEEPPLGSPDGVKTVGRRA